MSIGKIMWIVCGGIWVVLIVAFTGITIFNRIRNRQRKDK